MAALSPVNRYESRALRAATAARGWVAAHHKALVWAAAAVVLLLLLSAVRDVLREVRYDEIVAAMKATSAAQVALAALATLLSYVALTGYDWAALRYAGARVGYPVVAPTAFAAYALSNTVGFGVLTGGAVRMRLYGDAGVEPTTISRAIAFGTISFGIGTGFVAAFGLLADASTVAPLLHVPSAVLRAAAAIWLVLVAALLAVCAGRRTFARAASRVVALPSPGLAAWQLLVSVADIVFAAAALWWLLPASNVGPLAFVGFFALATLLGVVSHSPGGVGVFEGVMLVTLSSAMPAGQLAGALLLYRGLYFFAPLALALVMLSAYELRAATLSPLGRAAPVGHRHHRAAFHRGQHAVGQHRAERFAVGRTPDAVVVALGAGARVELGAIGSGWRGRRLRCRRGGDDQRDEQPEAAESTDPLFHAGSIASRPRPVRLRDARIPPAAPG